MLISKKEDGMLENHRHRKMIHTSRYLCIDSNDLPINDLVINTLVIRALKFNEKIFIDSTNL